MTVLSIGSARGIHLDVRLFRPPEPLDAGETETIHRTHALNKPDAVAVQRFREDWLQKGALEKTKQEDRRSG